jgi:hypothetical protein
LYPEESDLFLPVPYLPEPHYHHGMPNNRLIKLRRAINATHYKPIRVKSNASDDYMQTFSHTLPSSVDDLSLLDLKPTREGLRETKKQRIHEGLQ